MTAVTCGRSSQLDPTFDVGAGPNGAVLAIVVLPNGSILVGGDFSQWNHHPSGTVVRLNPDGSLDPTFETDLQTPVRQLFVLDGAVLAVETNSIVRLLPDGTRDTNFLSLAVTGPVAATEDFLYTVLVPPRPRPFLEVRAPDGTLLNTVYSGSVGDEAYRLVPYTENRVFMVGHFFIGVMPLFGPTGRDPSFNLQGVIDAWNAAVAPDGSVYAAVRITSQFVLWRLNASGQRDTNFAEVSGTIVDFANMAVQNDGRLIYGSDTLTRLNLDGSVDTTFAPNFAATTIHAIAVQPDGNILVGGSLGSLDGRDVPNIVRLLAATTMPPGFAISGRVTDGLNGVAGVLIKTRGGISTLTDQTGAYSLTVTKDGVYVVHPSLKGMRFTPSSSRVRATGDVVLPDFVARSKGR